MPKIKYRVPVRVKGIRYPKNVFVDVDESEAAQLKQFEDERIEDTPSVGDFQTGQLSENDPPDDDDGEHLFPDDDEEIDDDDEGKVKDEYPQPEIPPATRGRGRKKNN